MHKMTNQNVKNIFVFVHLFRPRNPIMPCVKNYNIAFIVACAAVTLPEHSMQIVGGGLGILP